MLPRLPCGDLVDGVIRHMKSVGNFSIRFAPVRAAKDFQYIRIGQLRCAIFGAAVQRPMQLFVRMVIDGGVPPEMTWVNAEAISAIVSTFLARRCGPVRKLADQPTCDTGTTIPANICITLAGTSEWPVDTLGPLIADITQEKLLRRSASAPRVSEMRRAADAGPGERKAGPRVFVLPVNDNRPGHASTVALSRALKHEWQ